MQTEQTVAISSKNSKLASFQDNCNGSVECFALGESVGAANEITTCPEFSAATFVGLFILLLLRLPATQVCYTDRMITTGITSSPFFSPNIKKTEQSVAIASKLLTEHPFKITAKWKVLKVLPLGTVVNEITSCPTFASATFGTSTVLL